MPFPKARSQLEGGSVDCLRVQLVFKRLGCVGFAQVIYIELFIYTRYLGIDGYCSLNGYSHHCAALSDPCQERLMTEPMHLLEAIHLLTCCGMDHHSAGLSRMARACWWLAVGTTARVSPRNLTRCCALTGQDLETRCPS